MIDTYQKTIIIEFEEYKFEVFVEFGFENRAIKLFDVCVSNQPPSNVNIQDFHHILNILRKQVFNGEYDDEIKHTVAKSINNNFQCSYPNTMSIVAIAIGAALALFIITTLL